jgi:hypothetical protein
MAVSLIEAFKTPATPHVAEVESFATRPHPIRFEGFGVANLSRKTSDFCDEFRDKETETPARNTEPAEGSSKWPLVTRPLGLPRQVARAGFGVVGRAAVPASSRLPPVTRHEPTRFDPDAALTPTQPPYPTTPPGAWARMVRDRAFSAARLPAVTRKGRPAS